MRIEMLETVRHQTPEGWLFTAEEQRTVSDETGRLFCAKGWARDLDGVVPTGARTTEPAELDVQDDRSASTSEDA